MQPQSNGGAADLNPSHTPPPQNGTTHNTHPTAYQPYQPQWMQYPAAAMAMMHQQQHMMMMYPPPPQHHPHHQAYMAAYYQQQQQYQKQPPMYQKQIQGSEDAKTVWIGDLLVWMDETYLHNCFSRTGEVSSVKVIRNKQTGQSEGYGFVEFYSHAAAEKVLQTYNGCAMPNSDQPFRLNWATFAGERRQEPNTDLSIFVGDLAADVTDSMLQETFAGKYPSVKGAKVVIDSNTGRTKGYGFVRFGDENIFVGGIDSDVTEEDLRQPFSQYGEVVSVKIPVGKGCGFVQFANRKDAEEALQGLNGTVIGKQTVRLSWGRSPANKQWRGDHGNQWNNNNGGGGYYGGGYGYSAQPTQDNGTYAASAANAAS
ncbi:Polyadenylate-binding protein RBP47C [Linum perenne]